MVGGEGRNDDVQPGTQHLVSGAAEAGLSSAANIHRADVAAVVCEAMNCPDAIQM